MRMVRTQIQITESQTQRLKKLAMQRGLSVAELIRQAIDLILQAPSKLTIDRQQKWGAAISVVGKFYTDAPALSIHHDEYFAQAIEGYPHRRTA